MTRLLSASFSFILIFLRMVNVSTEGVLSTKWADEETQQFLPLINPGFTNVSCVYMETCILPCSFQSGSEVAIHWKLDAGELFVHSYYENKDQLGPQSQYFRGRTSLFPDQISRGNASLQLTGVLVLDQQRYKCHTSTIRGNKESIINLEVNAPVRKVHIEQVENRIICSSKGIFPQPELTWSTNPPSNGDIKTTTTLQQNKEMLYDISSSLDLEDGGTDVVYSCTVRTRTNSKGASLREEGSISRSSSEIIIPCSTPISAMANLIWRFNNSQVILNRAEQNQTVSEEWRQHVKSVSESGSLTLQQLTPDQEGIYSCEVRKHGETHVINTFLRIEEQGHSTTGIIVGVLLGVLLLVGAVLVLYCIKCK